MIMTSVEAIFREIEKLETPQELAEVPKLLRALFFGVPGAGKTSLAGQLIEKKALVVYTDSNYTVLQKDPEIKSKISIVPFTGFDQIRTIAQAHSAGIEPYCKYDTLIWDTVSEAIQIMLRRVVSIPFSSQVHDTLESWEHYRMIKSFLGETLEVLNKSTLNVIYISHLQDASEDDKKHKQYAVRSNMPRACYIKLAQEVNLIGCLSKEAAGQPRKIQLEGSTEESAKSQIPTLPEGKYLIPEVITKIQEWKNS